MRKHYYASLTMIDEKVGQILDKLESKGLLENSIVIYTSDHGDHLFDLVADPGETANLWHDPAHRAIRDELTGELLDWLYTNLFKHRNLFIKAR